MIVLRTEIHIKINEKFTSKNLEEINHVISESYLPLNLDAVPVGSDEQVSDDLSTEVLLVHVHREESDETLDQKVARSVW